MFYWDLLVFFGTDAVENRSAQEVEETRKIFETMRDIHLANLPEIIRWVVHRADKSLKNRRYISECWYDSYFGFTFNFFVSL